MINSSNHKYKKDDNFFLEFFRTIVPYKWSILWITLLGMLLSATYLYFKPSIYEAQAIIKVKTSNNHRENFNELDPLGNLEISGAGEVDQELAILQTFYIHNKAIDRLNLHVQYFTKENYKKTEFFSNPPITIKEVTILDDTIIGRDIILHPKDNGFHIQIGKTINKTLFAYRGEVKTKQFKLTVHKASNFNIPIYFKLNGNNRNIYEKIIKKRLQVSRINANASLIRIKYQDNSSARAMLYVNALIDRYIAQSIVDKSKKNNKILDFVDSQLITTGKKLKLSESKLEEYRIQNNVIEPSVQSESLLNRLSDVEVQLSQSNIEKKLVQNLIEFVKNNRDLDSITPTLRELGDEPTIRVIENLQLLQQRANVLRAELTEKHPDLKAVRRDIKANKRTIIVNINNLKTNILDKQKNLALLKKEYEKSLKVLPTKEKQLIHLQRNHEVNSRMYSYLLEKKSENEMKKVATISDYEIIDRAYSNKRPIKPKKAMNLAIATIFSLIFATILAYLRNSMMNRLQNIKELKELTTLPIYGKVPISSKYTKLEISNKEPSSLLKSFRNLRTKINFNCENQKGSIILVTSSIEREGKTNIVSHLGNIFQMANYKSIIIDLDLHKPELDKNFDIEYDQGISNYLSEEDTVDNIVIKTEFPNLDIIPAGSIRADASELIVSKRLNTLLDTLKSRYDYIFIDSLPLSIEADTLHLMRYADINLIVIAEGFTKKSFISNLDETISDYQFDNVALLINSHEIETI